MPDQRILILEDDPALADLMQRWLQRAGFSITAAVRTGPDALLAAIRQPPDLALVDIHLPGEMDGIATAGWLRERFDVPVVLITGMADADTLRRVKESAAYGFLQKPFTQEELQATVALAWQRHQAQRRVELNLAERERRLRAIIDAEPECVKLLAADGTLLEMNPAGLAMVEADSPGEVVGRCVYPLIGPEHRAQFQALHERVFAGESGDLRFELIGLKGARRWLETHAVPLRDATGRITAALGLTRDITDRQQAEERLRASEANLAAAQRITRLGSWEFALVDLHDMDRNPLRWSDEVFRIFGYEPGQVEVSNPAFLNAVHPDDRAAVQQAFDTALRERKPYEIDHRIVRPDGTERIVHEHSEMVFDEGTGQPVKVVGTVQDITERKRMEESLRMAEAHYRTLFEFAPSGFLVQNAAGRIIDLNPAVCSMLGYAREELIGRPVWELTSAPRRLVQQHIAGILKGADVHCQTRNARKDGTPCDLELWETKIQLSDGSDGILVVSQDITERKRAEEVVQQSHAQLRSLAARLQTIREEERARIAREIHDEFGQLLTGFKMDVAWLDKQLAGLRERSLRASLARKVKKMSELLDEMVQSVRRISTDLRPGVLDDLGLVAAMEWQAREFQARTGIRCRFVSDVQRIVLDADRKTGVFRIFQETLTNVARHARASRVTVRLSQSNGTLTLVVKDNGAGITEQQITQTKSLGLLGMRERALMMGGEVLFAGRPGQGTTVTVRIPRADPARRTAKGTASKRALRSQPRRARRATQPQRASDW